MRHRIQALQIEMQDDTAEELLAKTGQFFGGRIALASSFGAEDQVLTDMLCRLSPATVVFTLDTGRLPEETYDLMERTRRRYDIGIEVLFPDHRQVEAMVGEHGCNLFYESIENRKRCCRVRKIEPLRRRLASLEAWFCGLREQQSPTREGLKRIDWDEAFGLVKVCPLADWPTEAVWDYIRRYDVPYNALHDRSYPSIGCAPCTRAVRAGEDIRSGRWWWETPEHKECGLHLHPEDKNARKEGQV